MTANNKKSLLVVVRQPPYASALARTSLEVALTSATFEQRVGVLFSGSGVLQLLSGQDSHPLGVRNIEKLLASFHLYDLDELFVEEAALARYTIRANQLCIAPRLLDSPGVRQLIAAYDHTLVF